MSRSIGVAIFGGSGFGAGELLRYLCQHPDADVVNIISSSQAGEPVIRAHPHLSGFYNESRFAAAIDWDRLGSYKQRVLFLALPHGHSAETIRELDKAQLTDTVIIDLSADFRIQADTIHSCTYPDVPFEQEVRSRFVYGLPELFKTEVSTTRHIANPGCLASASILAAAPLLQHCGDGIRGSICLDAKTGTSGAGRALQESMHHPLRHANFEAYKMLCHRHEPEIRQALGLDANGIPTMFVPHLLPVSRGIFITMYAHVKSPMEESVIAAIYRDRYHRCPFIRLRTGTPRLSDVVGTNFCDIAIAARGEQVVVMAALDNLGKGMAGQAIQNMNIACGLPESTGLLIPGPGQI